jgi:hypothetical protein
VDPTCRSKCYVLVRIGDISVGINTGLHSGKRGAVTRFLTGAGNFSLSKDFRAVFCLIGTRRSFSSVKGEKREAVHSLSPNAAVNGAWRYASASPVFLHGVHMDTFMPFYARLPWHLCNCRVATLLISWANDDFCRTHFPVSSTTGDLPECLSP